MFRQELKQSTIRVAFAQMELIYHAAVRNVRKQHGNAVIGLLMNILQTVILIAVMYILFNVLQLRGNAVRGDFILYVMSGIFLYMTHSKALGAVAGADGPTSAMMKHAPMNTMVAICSAALSALYLQVLSASIVLLFYHAAVHPITIFRPVPALGMLLVAWFSGCAIGMIFRAVKPWQPELFGILASLYARANMMASGKMFLANTLTPKLLAMFSWNPLFHAIDQERGFIFVNYHPHFSSVAYPIYVSLACLNIGLMGEFFTRKHVSLSWGAKR